MREKRSWTWNIQTEAEGQRASREREEVTQFQPGVAQAPCTPKLPQPSSQSPVCDSDVQAELLCSELCSGCWDAAKLRNDPKVPQLELAQGQDGDLFPQGDSQVQLCSWQLAVLGQIYPTQFIPGNTKLCRNFVSCLMPARVCCND